MDPRFDHSSRNDRDSGNDGSPTSDSGSPYPRRTSQDCATIEPLLEAFHDGALDLERARVVAEHLAGCPACSARLRELVELDRLVLAAPMPAPGPALRQRVYSTIAASQPRGGAVGFGAAPPALPRHGAAPSPRHGAAPSPRLGAAPSPRLGARAGAPAPTRRRSRGWLGGLALAAVALALIVIFVSIGHGPNQPGHPTTTATATSVPTTPPGTTIRTVPGASLPAFSDWRAVYLDANGVAHVASLDGKFDRQLTGPSSLQAYAGGAMSSNGTYFRGAGEHIGMSPDGRELAFITGIKNGTLQLLDFASSPGAPARLIQVAITIGESSGFAWSPDGTQLAAGGVFQGQEGLYLINARTGATTLVPNGQSGGAFGYDANQELYGWTDATHVLLYTLDYATHNYHLVTLDITTGAATPVAIPQNWMPTVILPGSDPSTIIVPNGCQGCPNPATGFALLDLKTGQVKRVPNVEQALGNSLFPAVANPTSATPILAAAPGTVQDSRAQVYLVDLLADTATPIGLPGEEPLGWTPDGRTLLVDNAPSNGGGLPDHAALAITPPAAGATSVVVTQRLTAFIGFVRTA